MVKPAAAPRKKVAASKKAGTEGGGGGAKKENTDKEYLRLKSMSMFGKQPAEGNGAKFSRLPKALRELGGGSIVQPKAAKKRYLLSFPATVDMSNLKHKSIGTLARLDTYTPCLYFEFEEGRAKLVGYRQYIEKNIIAFESKNDGLSVVQQFDHLIVFSELVWIGTEELNPNEHPLPFPAELLGKAQKPSKRSKEPVTATTLASKNAATNSSATTATVIHLSDSDDCGAASTSGGGGAIETTVDSGIREAGRRSSRRGGAKRKSYVDRGSSDEDFEGSDDSNDGGVEEIVAESQEAAQATGGAVDNKVAPSRTQKRRNHLLASSSDDEDADIPSADNAKTAPSAAATKQIKQSTLSWSPVAKKKPVAKRPRHTDPTFPATLSVFKD